MGKTEYKSDGSAPQPPEGGWQESNINSLHGRELVRLIQSGQITVSVVVRLLFAVWYFGFLTILFDFSLIIHPRTSGINIPLFALSNLNPGAFLYVTADAKQLRDKIVLSLPCPRRT
jgi:hypothetical protein